MAINIYLAASPAQISKIVKFPKKIAWMACHFSPSGTGLCSLPRWLPPESLLILDDSTPLQGHDPGLVRQQLEETAADLSCGALLLDFQRPGAEAMAAVLSRDFPCPVAITPLYAHITSGPVLLPPVPLYTPPQAHTKDWAGRELWLELSAEGCDIRLTGTGPQVFEEASPTAGRFTHNRLHCSYDISLAAGSAVFQLRRNGEQLSRLLLESEKLGVTAAVGMLQEFPEFG